MMAFVREPWSSWFEPPARERWSTALWCSVAAFALGQAVHVDNGNVHPKALAWLTVACITTLLGVAAPTHDLLERAGERVVVVVLGLGIAHQIIQLFLSPLGLYVRVDGPAAAMELTLGLVVAAVLAGMGLAKKPWLGRAQFPLLLITFAWLGAQIIDASPSPHIDVHSFQREAVEALLAGENPYALRYPDIYEGLSPFYGEGISVGGVLQFGYLYPPLSLLLALPGHVLFGDHRYSQLAAMLLSAACVAYARPGRVGVAAATLLLLTPRTFLVLELAWTEPFVLLGLSAVVFVALRCPRSLPWVLGLALAVKQYTVFMLPAALHLWPRPLTSSGRFLLKAAGVGALVTLPFFLWGPKDFWFNVVELQFHQPLRVDALSYLAWFAQRGSAWPLWLPFAAAIAGVGLGLVRQPRTPAGFAATCALAYLAFFALNKQAFCNYYYFTLGTLLVAVGATAPDAEPAQATQTVRPDA